MPGQEKTAWFCQKISQLKNSMYVTAIGILRNKEDAEDAIQNALMQGYDHLDDLRFFDKIKPWILRILVNECYKILKKRMYVPIEKIKVILPYESTRVKKDIVALREEAGSGKLIDATKHKPIKTVVVLDDGTFILCTYTAETLAKRYKETQGGNI